jgi:hypothetical protein
VEDEFGEVTVDETEREAVLRGQFGEPTFVDGKPRCMSDVKYMTKVKKENSGTLDDFCMLDAGRGTSHSGYGPCDLHGGDTDSKALELDSSIDQSYVRVIKNQRLKELFEQERNRENIDNLDDEIVLVSSMLQLVAESFGMDLDTETGEVTEIESPTRLRAQSAEMIGLVRQKSALIKNKYEIMQIAGEAIPRSRVRSYLMQVQLILSQTLRDVCPHCNKAHNMRSNALTALELVGGL